MSQPFNASASGPHAHYIRVEAQDRKQLGDVGGRGREQLVLERVADRHAPLEEKHVALGQVRLKEVKERRERQHVDAAANEPACAAHTHMCTRCVVTNSTARERHLLVLRSGAATGTYHLLT
jgi:hypothetical protein